METYIRLLDIPHDLNFEDFIAAHLNAEGYFLERNVRMIDDGVILELDVVTYRFDPEGHAEKKFIEAKSGDWGFPDIFKIKGWMVYIDFPEAYFVVIDNVKKKMSLYDNVAKYLEIKLLSTPIGEGKLDDHELYDAFGIQKRRFNDFLVPSFRYAYALERMMNSHLKMEIAAHKDSTGLANLKKLIATVSESSFFVRSPRKRVLKIFEAYRDNVRITAKISHELQGESYAKLSDDIDIRSDDFSSIFHTCTGKNVLYTSLYAELIEKMNILKCCVEDIGYKEESSIISSIEASLLPLNIKEGIRQLKSYAHYYQYPYLMQVFVYAFGGFVLKEKQTEEYEMLSEISGIPVDEIDNALHVFDVLFPIEGGSWLQEVPYSGILQLTMMPIPLSGIGANLRRKLYCKSGDYDELKKQISTYAYKDLIKWNNLAYVYLEASKDVVKMEGDARTAY